VWWRQGNWCAGVCKLQQLIWKGMAATAAMVLAAAQAVINANMQQGM
jgi:hypothetical protein